MQGHKIHEFKKSLKKGQKAEAEFLELFKDKVIRLDGMSADFEIIKNGKKIELKTDFYDESKTANFFWERYSAGMAPGGAHQALAKGTDYVVYWFIGTMSFYTFKTAELVAELDKLTKGMYVINVYNSNHVTRGYKVPRSELEHICLKLEDIL